MRGMPGDSVEKGSKVQPKYDTMCLAVKVTFKIVKCARKEFLLEVE